MYLWLTLRPCFKYLFELSWITREGLWFFIMDLKVITNKRPRRYLFVNKFNIVSKNVNLITIQLITIQITNSVLNPKEIDYVISDFIRLVDKISVKWCLKILFPSHPRREGWRSETLDDLIHTPIRTDRDHIENTF